MATYTDELRVYWEIGKGGLLTIEQNTPPYATRLLLHENEVTQLIEMLAESLNELYNTKVHSADDE